MDTICILRWRYTVPTEKKYCKHLITDIQILYCCSNSNVKMLTHTTNNILINASNTKQSTSDWTEQLNNSSRFRSLSIAVYWWTQKRTKVHCRRLKGLWMCAAVLQQAVIAFICAVLVMRISRWAVPVMVTLQDGDNIMVAKLHGFVYRCVPPP